MIFIENLAPGVHVRHRLSGTRYSFRSLARWGDVLPRIRSFCASDQRQNAAAVFHTAWAGSAIGVEGLTVVANRGYFKGEEILACDQSGITAYVPKPLTSNSKADGRFGKQDFAYVPEKNEYASTIRSGLRYRIRVPSVVSHP
ncbi:hypothetical protein D9M68_873000 [compost metagenome]